MKKILLYWRIKINPCTYFWCKGSVVTSLHMVILKWRLTILYSLHILLCGSCTGISFPVLDGDRERGRTTALLFGLPTLSSRQNSVLYRNTYPDITYIIPHYFTQIDSSLWPSRFFPRWRKSKLLEDMRRSKKKKKNHTYPYSPYTFSLTPSLNFYTVLLYLNSSSLF